MQPQPRFKRATSALALIALTATLGLAASPPAYAAPALKRPDADGSVPRRWNLPKPPAVPHPDVAPAGAGGLIGDGSNLLSFASFDDGDMVVVLGSTFGHAGIWSDALYSAAQGLNSYCVWSANVTPRNGVQREQPAKYRTYDRAYGLWVPGKSLYGKAVVSYCAAQSGEPYVITSAKTDTSAWYCSKLPWVGWRLKTGVDLDADGGYWVWPVDLVNDAQTAVFAMSD